MGMYTHIEAKVTFKPEVAAIINAWYGSSDDSELWEYVGNKLESQAVLEFSEDHRSSFIPNAPFHLGYKVLRWEGDTLHFTCSLKDYGTSSDFMDLLESELATDWEMTFSNDYLPDEKIRYRNGSNKGEEV